MCGDLDPEKSNRGQMFVAFNPLAFFGGGLNGVRIWRGTVYQAER